MRRWFEALPLHRKLVVLALAVTTVALLLAMTGFVAADLWRYRASAAANTRAIAQILAENLAASVQFGDALETQNTVDTLRGRLGVGRACVYSRGRLLAGVHGDYPACPPTPPSGTLPFATAEMVPVTRADRVWGSVYVEREASELYARAGLALAFGMGVLLLAGGAAVLVANRLHRLVSRPVAELAAAARAVGSNSDAALPQIESPPDEIGDLVRAFTAMAEKVRSGTAELRRSNEVLLREIDVRRRAEQDREFLLAREQQANRLKDEFLAAVSHELRTPLNSILGWAQVLKAAPPSEDVLARATTSLLRNVKAQARVIDDLIDISRIVTGKLSMQIELLDLRTVVEAAWDVSRPSGRAKGLELTLVLPPDRCPVHGDPDRLQQVFWNLLTNAVKFTPSGGTVTATLADEGSRFRFTVTDTGIGIEPAFLPYAFERFRQADGSLNRPHSGLGIGLAIVKELTGLHGGSVSVKSPGRDQGTSFSVILPRADKAVPGTVESAASRPSLAGIVVLAVDDHEDALDILVTALSTAGASVRAVTSGAAAVEAWRAEPADVLVCDLAMPDMDGFELLGALREIDVQRGRVTPAIAVTAQASGQDEARSIQRGFNRHVSKPYDFDTIVAAVAAVLERESPGVIRS